MRRAQAAQFLFPERIHSAECYSGISFEEKGKDSKEVTLSGCLQKLDADYSYLN